MSTFPSEVRQGWVLKALIAQVQLLPLKPVSITLNHCAALTTNLLEPFLHAQLEHLDLRYCKNIGNPALAKIHSSCPQLKTLRLSGCTALTSLTGSYFFTTLLKFPHLEHLEINRCENLQTVQIKAPALTRFEGKHNPTLSKVTLQTIGCEVDLKESPQVQLTHIQVSVWKRSMGDPFWGCGGATSTAP